MRRLFWTGMTAPCFVAALALAGPVPSKETLDEIGFDQRLDATIPSGVRLVDESGQALSFHDLAPDRPSLLVPVYFECPMLCNLTLNGLLRTLRAIPLTAGQDFDVIVFSIDPSEGPDLAAAKKGTYVRAYGRPGGETGWRFLTGNQAQIRRLTEALGFRYVKDPNRDAYAHAAGLAVLTPGKRIARYFFGAEFPPRDVRLALVEAGDGRIGRPIDRLLLACFHYDPSEGRYTLAIMNAVRGFGAATVVLVGAGVGLFLRRERRQRRR